MDLRQWRPEGVKSTCIHGHVLLLPRIVCGSAWTCNSCGRKCQDTMYTRLRNGIVGGCVWTCGSGGLKVAPEDFTTPSIKIRLPQAPASSTTSVSHQARDCRHYRGHHKSPIRRSKPSQLPCWRLKLNSSRSCTDNKSGGTLQNRKTLVFPSVTAVAIHSTQPRPAHSK